MRAGCFVKVCKRRDLKVNAGKSKVIILGGEEGLIHGTCILGVCVE